MSQLEEKLNKVHLQKMTEVEKNSVWLSIVSKQTSTSGQKKLLELFFSKKYMMATLLALVVILGGGGVVAASNASVPGDTLYGIDQAVENIQIKLTSAEDKKSELKLRFAEERLSEVEKVIQEGSQATRSVDLSTAQIIEIEIDVFTNETTVTIEADDKKYGFVTDLKDKNAIIAEIQTKYSLPLEKINANLSFETEDRASRADDKKFLNSANSIEFKSQKQKQEFEGSLSDVASLVANSNLSEEEKAKLQTTLTSIMAILAVNPNLEIELKTEDGYKIEVEDGKVEIKTRGNGSDDSSDDDSSDDDQDDSNHGNDTKEDDSEVFCRGEWRDSEDCVENDSDESNDDSEDDNDSDESDDDSNDDSDDEESDDDNSGSGKDDEEDHDNDSEDDSNDDNDDSESEDDDEDNSGSDNDDDDND